MNTERYISLAALLFSALVVYGPCRAQEPQSTLEQQIATAYRITSVGVQGTILGPGSVLVVKKDGIAAMPASSGGYFPNRFAKGDKIQPVGVRLLRIGERVFVTKIHVEVGEVTFDVQSCPACDPSSGDGSALPVNAALTFQFPGPSLSSTDMQRVRETVGEVFAIDDTPRTAMLLSSTSRKKIDVKLGKTKKPVLIGDVAMQLEVADPRRKRYTVLIVADDKATQKSDKAIGEPVQFYTAKGGHVPYALVITEIAKDTIIGYLLTPNTASAPQR